MAGYPLSSDVPMVRIYNFLTHSLSSLSEDIKKRALKVKKRLEVNVKSKFTT